MINQSIDNHRASVQVQAILEAWLHPTSSCTTSPLSGWVTPEENVSRRGHSSQLQPSSSSPFQRPLDLDLWVLPEETLGSGGPAEEEEEEDKWLLKKRSQAQVTQTGPVQTS